MLSRKRTRQTEHTDGRRRHRSTQRRTDSRSYSSREESRNRLHIQRHRHHERNHDPRHGHPRETPANPQQRHRQNVNHARRPKTCLTVGQLATSKESADNPDEESKKYFKKNIKCTKQYFCFQTTYNQPSYSQIKSFICPCNNLFCQKRLANINKVNLLENFYLQQASISPLYLLCVCF